MTTAPELNTYFFDGHGHSVSSDGMNRPDQIVKSAHQKGIDILGLSDHDTIAGWPNFLAAVDSLNDGGTNILAIPAVEVMTRQGDMWVGFPERDNAQRFQKSYRPDRIRPNMLERIQEYTNEYNALCILLHPEAPYVNGVTIPYIELILERLTTEQRGNMGIELSNWMAQIFFWNRAKVEQKLTHRNEDWDLAKFSFTDYHQARHVGNGTTNVQMSGLTPEAFRQAFVGRQTAPTSMSHPSVGNFLASGVTSAYAEVISRVRGRYVPRLRHAQFEEEILGKR